MAGVALTKDIEVIQQVVELIEGASLHIAPIHRKVSIIAFVEGGWKATKQFGHSNIGFAIAIIKRWIENKGLALLTIATIT